MHSTYSPRILHQKGIAMVTVIFVTTIVFILGVVLSVAALGERRSVTNNRQTSEALQLADAVSEQARVTVVETFNTSPYNISNFMRLVKNGEIGSLAGIKSVQIGDVTGYWRVQDVASPTSSNGWIDVAATVELAGGTSQTIVKRVGFGHSSTFNLAMLSETTNCMFCHLQVKGDVGNIVAMRPGWGDEGGIKHPGSINSGNGSMIQGNVFAARTVTNDGTARADETIMIDGKSTTFKNVAQLNGAGVTGVVEQNSRNAGLPTDIDGDGIADFPPIYREKTIQNATGLLRGAAIMVNVPLEGSLSSTATLASLTTNITGVNKTHDGNLILIGTPENPIDLSGDIWVEGDVVIRGVVEGQGALYTGRNVYIAGDITLQNPPYTVGTAPCTGFPTGTNAEDECAKLSVRDGKDAFRIGARANVIVGDYTEKNLDGSNKSYAGVQSADFYRDQFGFNDTSQNRYYDKATGDELSCSGSGTSQVCKNVDGQQITDVKSVNKTAAYDYSIRPGAVSNTGNFLPWLSDGQYSQILGQETYSRFIWRKPISSSMTQANFINELIKTGFSAEGAAQIAAMREGKGTLKDNNGVTRTESGTVKVKDALGGDIEVNVPDMFEKNVCNKGVCTPKFQSGTMKARYLSDRTWETQVNKIDAFLYANQRIAGKVNEQALVINGGLVAKELGILAPGRGSAEKNKECQDTKSLYYVKGSIGCAMTVNYDHRLRNGGYGYNNVSGVIGQVLSWSIGSEDKTVKP
jgi:hypothetical protein